MTRRTAPGRDVAFLPIALLLFAAGWGANQFVALLPLYRTALGLSGEQATLVFGVYAVTVVPSLVVGGPLSDRFGRRGVTIAAAAVALLGNLGLAFGGGTFEGLLAGRFLVGLGSGAAFSAGSSWLVDLDPLESARRSTVAMAGGFGAGPLIAGALATLAPAPLVAPYVVQGAVVVAAAALASTVRVEASRARTSEGGASGSTLAAASFVRRVVLVAPWVFAFPSLGFVVVPSLFASGGGATPVFVGVMAACALFTGAAVARLAVRRPGHGVASGLLAGASGLIVSAVAASMRLPALAAAGAVLLGVGYGWTMTRTFRFVATTTSERSRATVVGLTYALTYVGFGAPLLFVRLARDLGPTGALLAFAAAATTSAALGRAAAQAT